MSYEYFSVSLPLSVINLISKTFYSTKLQVDTTQTDVSLETVISEQKLGCVLQGTTDLNTTKLVSRR